MDSESFSEQQPQNTTEYASDGKHQNKTKVIVFLIIAFVIVAVFIATYLIVNNINHLSDSSVGHPSKGSYYGKPFESWTKEDALAFLRQSDKTYNLPAGMIDESIKFSEKERGFVVLYSYADESEIPRIAADSVLKYYTKDNSGAEESFEIQKIDDIYSVVSIKPEYSDTKSSSYAKGIVFNKAYLDYRRVQTANNYGVTEENNVATIIKLDDRRVVEEIMNVWTAASMTNLSVYERSFSDNDLYYKIRVNIVGVGPSLVYRDYQNDFRYAVNTYYLEWKASKKTGEIEKVRNKDDSGYTNVIKRFELTPEESKEIEKLSTEW